MSACIVNEEHVGPAYKAQIEKHTRVDSKTKLQENTVNSTHRFVHVTKYCVFHMFRLHLAVVVFIQLFTMFYCMSLYAVIFVCVFLRILADAIVAVGLFLRKPHM